MNPLMRILCIAVVFLHITPQSSADELPELQLPDLPQGWQWDFEPETFGEWWTELGILRFTDGGAITLNPGADGGAIAQYIRTEGVDLRGTARPSYNVYVFWRDGEPLRVSSAYSMSNDRMEIVRLTYNTNEPADVIGLAVAAITLEDRKQRAAEFASEATERGIDVLPLPILDEPLPFELHDINGEVLQSNTFEGEVVLFVAWATWCRPCMATVPELKKVHEMYADRGLRIIGLNFDREWESAAGAIEKHDMDWPQVHAAADEDHRTYWRYVSSIHGLPRVLLVDREGVLREDMVAHVELDELLAPYFQ